jgi:hypothetical protein
VGEEGLVHGIDQGGDVAQDRQLVGGTHVSARANTVLAVVTV